MKNTLLKLLFSCFLIALATACGSSAQRDPLRVMTFNMRYDNPEDGVNNWKFRYEEAARVILEQGIDLLGAQELLINQLNDMKCLLKDYTAVGVAREDGHEKGEHSAIFFRKDRFKLVDSGNFWLSETPEVAGSFGWDAACVRIATWAVLKDRRGKEILFMNTHLDHEGETARREGVGLLLERIESLAEGRPVVLTGDFNAKPDSEVIRTLLSSGVLRHTRDLTCEVKGTTWSFHNYGRLPEEERPLIDYVFVNEGFVVKTYEVLPETSEGKFISDHAPVVVDLCYEE